MESTKKTHEATNKDDHQVENSNSFDEYYNQLPKDTSLGNEMVYQHGFWIWSFLLKPVLSFQTYFETRCTDLFIAGMPKTGNTWIKSLVFATIHRHHQPISESLLLHHNAHNLVPIPEFGLDLVPGLRDAQIDQGVPRLLATHMPYEALPQSLKDSGCRIIYICRNPLDAFVSSWFFYKGVMRKKHNVDFASMEDYFEDYLKGVTPFGPFFEHVLGYWKKNVEIPDKVLFIKYEEMLKDTKSELKKIAGFIKHPFSMEEEQGGVIEEIIELCSIKNLKELKVNKEGDYKEIDNHFFFRKGQVGDWSNHLTPPMVDRMRELMRQKFHGVDLPIQDTWF